MKEKFSKYSMLKSTLTMEERHIALMIDEVGRNLRAMCRVMQVYGENTGTWIKDSAEDLQEMKAVFDVFYEFVDKQIDPLSTLVDAIEANFNGLSIEGLRENAGFNFKGIPQHAFVSREAYLNYCQSHGVNPLDDFNDEFGDTVAPANSTGATQ